MIRLKKIIVLSLIGLFFTRCASLDSMLEAGKNKQVSVKPNPLELHGGKVSLDMSVILPPKLLQAGKVYSIRTFYDYGNKSDELPSFDFKVSDYPGLESTSIKNSKNYVFDYSPEKEYGALMIQARVIDATKTPQVYKDETGKIKIADGIITTPLLVLTEINANFVHHGYNDQDEIMPINVDFFFEQGKADLRVSEKTGESGKRLTVFIAEKNVTKTVTIIGTHSPEGREAKNITLSENRAKAIEKWYRENMKKYDYKGLSDSIKFILKPITLDWANLKEVLKNTTLLDETTKTNILGVINGYGTFEEKEKAIEQFPNYKSEILGKIYPLLRTAKTEILTLKSKKSLPTIAIMSKQIAQGANVDSLTYEELLYGAHVNPSIDEQELIYKASISKKDSWEAHNNLGSIYLLKAKTAASSEEKNNNIELALTQLEIANKQKSNTPEIYATFANIYLLQGQVQKSYDLVNKAFEVTNPSGQVLRNLNTIKGILEIKLGIYDKAIASLSQASETMETKFNRALAQLLKGESTNAQHTFADALSLNYHNALTYYLLAITYARLNNESELMINLKKAIEENPELKEKALRDLEFKNYASSIRSSL